MTIDFKAEVEKRREALLADLFIFWKSTQNEMIPKRIRNILLDLDLFKLHKFLEMLNAMVMKRRMWTIMLVTLLLVRVRKNLGFLPTWM